MRSGFEKTIAQQLRRAKVKFGYESKSYVYTVTKKYWPDFNLASGVVIETKGRFFPSDRTKTLKVLALYPDLDLRFVFMRDQKLSKNSKTMYSDWCKKHGIKYAFKKVPKEWLRNT